MFNKTDENNYAISAYSRIIVEAFNQMVQDLELTGKPIMDGGREGKESFGHERESFKYAIIVVSFVGKWLHANLRSKMIATGMDQKKYLRHKAKPYEQRLMIIGCYDQIFIDKVACYRIARNKIIYEMERFDTAQILFVEEEAKKAYELFVELTNEFAR